MGLFLLPFYHQERKGVRDLESVERLVAAGLKPHTAVETALWFVRQGDDQGLEDYVQEAEARHRNGNAMRLGASDR